MTQSEKETILVKLQEITSIIQGIPCQEANLFDQEFATYIKTQEDIPPQVKPRRTRQRAKDGTMTAATIAHALSKELNRDITKDSVVRVAKHIKVKPTYSHTQHTSRYSAEAVNTIMNLYRSFNQI